MSLAVSYSAYGGPDVLEIIDVPEPHAGPGQVRVAVRAAGLNAFDYKLRRSPAVMPSHTLPSRQGSEFAGVIDELGDGVTGLAVGDEVLGWAPLTAQAEFVVVNATHVAAKPAGLDWASAGGLYSVGNTALRSTDAVAPTAADTVLVSAAAGGVGILAAQFALRTGATVIGTASEQNHEFLRGLGVIPVAYGPGLVDRLRAAAPQGITAVIDNAGEETVLAALELGVAPARINSVVYFEGADKYGISVVGSGKKTSAELWELARLVASGELVLPIAATYPLAQVREAYERLESRHLRGKVVLLVG
ncbi:NADP-dependent oxidoreductase [Lacisediminihabitans changchengi]|uniref:NADP-dependent oxidoreductase n=1 Tax=Lacisediminihabitans changchengi TaxID=2787634 RepID=A0A934W338_9MICO|nr:NADP-dependent oxidoreductase [Lacisediminihabitans changchengi]MBK4347506.1 NADP-dependent oxidoreductase [Lacisediminihabitans changchengi]